MRELHSVLEYIHFAGKGVKPIREKEKLDENIQVELFQKLNQAFKNIESFKEKAFMLA